jgi:hypothetical protein
MHGQLLPLYGEDAFIRTSTYFLSALIEPSAIYREAFPLAIFSNIATSPECCEGKLYSSVSALSIYGLEALHSHAITMPAMIVSMYIVADLVSNALRSGRL